MSKECIILPNELFDDGSVECKTFCIVDGDDPLVCEFNTVKKLYPELIPQILKAIADGKAYIGFTRPSTEPLAFGTTEKYCEIQWD